MQGPPLPPDQLGPRLAEVFRVIGPLYRQAARIVLADEPLEQVSTSVRALLERLLVVGPEPVPAVARALGTSRQFVQRTANEAAASGLIELEANPAHRRSSLLVLTGPGRTVIERITAREQRVLGAAPGDLTEAEIATCLHVLRQLLTVVRGRLDPDA